MSQPTANSGNVYAPPELAPSETAIEVPQLSRLVGMVGLFCLTAGVVSIVAAQYGRGWLGEGVGYLLGVLGLAGLLIHATRDADLEIRRVYGLFALVLLAAAVVISVYPGKTGASAEGHVGAWLLPWGVSLGFLSLLFLVPFARHETEAPFHEWIQYLLLGVGGLLAVGSVVAGVIVNDFLVGPGILLALLGLGFLCAFLSQIDTTDGLGYSVGVGLGVLGAVSVAVAVGLAVVPSVLHEGPNAIRNASQSYDKWQVIARVVSILGVLAVASLGFTKRLPLWFRSVAVVLGLALAGVLIVGSFAKPIVHVPVPFLVPYGLILAGLGVVFLGVSAAVITDNQFVVLTRRELSAYFYSPIAYIVLFGMNISAWLGYAVFVSGLSDMSQESGGVPEPIVRQYLSLGIVGAITVIFLVPALTMRLFSEEKRTGTLEVLLTAPVNEATIVLSKFTASWLFYMICWLPPGLYLVALRIVGGEPFDYRPMLSYYLALGCSGAAFLAMGLFFSSVTRNQIIAAVLTFLGMMFLLLTITARDLAFLDDGIKVIFRRLDFLSLWQQALAGQLAVQNVVIQLSIAVFWLFLTVKVLEVRKWS